MVLKTISVNRVVLYPSDRVVDFQDNLFIADELINRLPKTIMVDFLDTISITEALSLIERSCFVITGRLYVGVIAAIYKVPFQLLNYSSKNRFFIKDMGINEKVLVQYEALNNEMTMTSNLIELYRNFSIPKSFPPETGGLVKKLADVV